jgi:hypothetical protein
MRSRLAYALFFALCATPGLALAQTLPADPPLAIHGFNDLTIKNGYLTPRGLLVTSKGLTTQILNGLVFDVYNRPDMPLDDIAIVGGVWNDLSSSQRSTTVGPWNEFDWFIGANFEVDHVWTFGASYVAFLSPPGNFSAEHNIEFSAKFDDSKLLAPISLHPYAKLFYEIHGPSVVVTGKGGGSFDVELGVVPTWDLHPYNFPATLTAPTWLTVGPSDFWGGGGNLGVFSTGLTATFPLEFMPKSLGGWNFHVGAQYYDMINNNLLVAQQLIGSTSTRSRGHRNFVLGMAGIGVNF